MAESSTQEQQKQSSGNGSEGRKTALRAAAIAAASGATAIAARKAFSGSHQQQEDSSSKQNGGGDSLVGGMLGSGWHAARDSIVPFAEDAANAAGEYLAKSGPDFVRETIVPAFIEGFQSAQQSSGDE